MRTGRKRSPSLEWLGRRLHLPRHPREFVLCRGGARPRHRLQRAATPGLGILSRRQTCWCCARVPRAVTTTPAIREFLDAARAADRQPSPTSSRGAPPRLSSTISGSSPTARGGEPRRRGALSSACSRSTAYTRSVAPSPMLRAEGAAQSWRGPGFDPRRPLGKALFNVLETYPRDELFQIDEDTLFEHAHADPGARRAAAGPRARPSRPLRPVRLGHRLRAARPLRQRRRDKDRRLSAEVFEGHVSAFYPAFPEGTLARVRFIIGRSRRQDARPRTGNARGRGRGDRRATWEDALRRGAARRRSTPRADARGSRVRGAFPAGYRETASTPAEALAVLARSMA